MNHLKCVIFDLDGTLVNTIEDLGRACDYLLERKSLPLKWSTEDYKNFVGDGAKLLVDRAFEGRLSQAELSEQYELFKKKYNQIKLDNAYVYDGIYELVDYLKKAGLFLAVCTNKPNASAKSMVNALFGEKTFDYVLGAVDGLAKKPDRAMPSAILNRWASIISSLMNRIIRTFCGYRFQLIKCIPSMRWRKKRFRLKRQLTNRRRCD